MSRSEEKNRAFRVEVLFLLAALVSAGICLWLAGTVRDQRSLPWDATVLRLFHSSTSTRWDKPMAHFARSGEISVIVVLSVIGVLVLKHQRRMRDALFLTLSIVGVVIINLLVRTVVQRHQSDVWGAFAPTFESGFPSSQAADSLAIVLAFAILAWKTRWRWTVLAPGILYVLAIGVFRIHLGLHYPSDIIAGWALAFAWVTIVSFARPIPNGKSPKPDSDA